MIHLMVSMVANPQRVCSGWKLNPQSPRRLDSSQAFSAPARRQWTSARSAAHGVSDMSSQDIAATSLLRRDETIAVALLLAFAGGYLDAYTWIIHGVMANAQTANLVFLWVHGMAGDWAKALHFIPPILAFAVGIVIAALAAPRCGGESQRHQHLGRDPASDWYRHSP
ncbi:YoaK family protein [Bradyrhizobium guangxiense]